MLDSFGAVTRHDARKNLLNEILDLISIADAALKIGDQPLSYRRGISRDRLRARPLPAISRFANMRITTGQCDLPPNI